MHSCHYNCWGRLHRHIYLSLNSFRAKILASKLFGGGGVRFDTLRGLLGIVATFTFLSTSKVVLLLALWRGRHRAGLRLVVKLLNSN